MKRRHLRKRPQEVEIHITAFLNLMVVLIPFLLITAVFSQVAVLDLFVPDEQGSTEQSTVQARIVIRKQHLEVGNANTGPLEIITNKNNNYDFETANQRLQDIKTKHPAIRHITLLLEDDVDYESLIHAMDHARYFNKTINGQKIKAELFPAISIGSAPPLAVDKAKEGGNQ
ncbi:MAG: biopolymer transporter ExbD [Pseudomonadales bacterium]|nr:biopolymer transporter ExbD [Pseudomonadales bacterium]